MPEQAERTEDCFLCGHADCQHSPREPGTPKHAHLVCNPTGGVSMETPPPTTQRPPTQTPPPPAHLSRERELMAEVKRLKGRIADALALATESQPPDLFLKFEAILAPKESADA